MGEYDRSLRSDYCQTSHRRRSAGLGRYVSLVGEVAIAVATFWFVVVASTAEITIGRWVVLEGPIEIGDYDKLRDFFLARRDYSGHEPLCFEAYLDGCPDSIYLASPGGDVVEAMKIGRLVRALGWETMAPARTLEDATGAKLRQTQIERYGLEDAKSNFMCASACFFVFVGGIERNFRLRSKPDNRYSQALSAD